ncbi:MAG: TadE family protein [Bacteroidota bacterium]
MTRPGQGRFITRLHSDTGASSSLEFAVSFFMFLLAALTIAQLALLFHARMLVQYAASCAVRSAVVWIPSEGRGEPANEITCYSSNGDCGEEGGSSGDQPSKMYHIHMAAAIACLPLAPTGSRQNGVEGMQQGIGEQTWTDLLLRYLPEEVTGSMPARIYRKLGNSLNLTTVSVRPPAGGGTAYEPRELVVVTVAHRYYPDIPGPLTVMEPFITLADSAALPNNGEEAFPGLGGGVNADE